MAEMQQIDCAEVLNFRIICHSFQTCLSFEWESWTERMWPADLAVQTCVCSLGLCFNRGWGL